MSAEIDDTASSVAVVGLACRVPGAEDAATFWRNVCGGTESIRNFSPDDLVAAGVPVAVLADSAYVPAGGWLDGIDRFDAGLFGVPAREAAAMDPQHRIFLECVWSALEDAGCVPESPHRTGLFAGASSNDWLIRLLRDRDLVDAIGMDQVLLGTEKDFLVSRVAYRLGLSGPVLAVQTACSSSLAAVHLAVRSLLILECDVAVAGGVSVTFLDPVGYWHEHGGIRSPDGRCRAFDVSANGTVAGNGVGAVVLKRFSDAIADGDSVRAVVSGTAINNDGSAKASFTAPSVHGQAAVITEALAVAGISADTVDYLEAHGTGTSIGDPLELTALGEVFGERPATDPVLLGSVKPNIGHLDAASGVVGLIKTVLAVEAGVVPATISGRGPTEAVDWSALGVTPNTSQRPWPVREKCPRRAGVSSFGIGGTNVHVIVESAPDGTGVPVVRSSPRARMVHTGQLGSAGHLLCPGSSSEPVGASTAEIVTVSGADAAAVDRGIGVLCGYASRAAGSVSLRDVAATTRTGRSALASRAAVVCRSMGELARLDERSWIRGHADVSAVVFLFPGESALYRGAGSGLYQAEPVFRAEVDTCSALLDQSLAVDVRDVLLGRGDHDINETRLAQPALFVLEYALARLWQHWGIRPRAMLGCGVGEFVSACLAGVLSLPDAVRLVTERGRLVHDPPDDVMAAVTADRPFVSMVPGDLVDPDQLTDPEYWGGRLRVPVRFADAVDRLATMDGSARPMFVEVGPGTALTGLVRTLSDAPAVPSLPSASELTDPAVDRITVLHALATVWTLGASVDWARHGSGGDPTRKVPLPTYPFAPQRHWPDGLPRATSQAGLYAPEQGVPAQDAQAPAERPAGEHYEVTEFLLRSWGELLGVRDVHGDSDFFELGGESLLAVRLTERIRRRFDVRIPPTQLFDTPTVDTLASVVHAARSSGESPVTEDVAAGNVVAQLVEEIIRLGGRPGR